MVSTGRACEWRFAAADDVCLHSLAPRRWREKSARMRFAADRDMELAAGGLLAEMLRERGLADLVFEETSAGKPQLVGGRAPYFSISHSHGMVMVAVADEPVGCDLERIGEFDPDVARAALTDGEYAAVMAMPSADWAAEFVRLWTLKEAHFKADGSGMPGNLSAVEASGLRSESVPAPDGFKASIAVFSAAF